MEVTIKVFHKNDIRRFAVQPNIRLDNLQRRISKVFGFDPQQLKYVDEDGDLVTLSTTNELSERLSIAQNHGKALRVIVDDAGVAVSSSGQGETADTAVSAASAPPVESEISEMEQNPEGEELSAAPRAIIQVNREAMEAAGIGDVTDDQFERVIAALGMPPLKLARLGLASVTYPAGWKSRACGKSRGCEGRRLGGAKTAHRHTPEAGARKTVTTRRALVRVVKHVSLPNGEDVMPGGDYEKTWRLRNDSEECWPDAVELIKVSHDELACSEDVAAGVPVRGGVTPQGEVDVTVHFTAPTEAGEYTHHFRLRDAKTKRKFGQRFPLSFSVTAASTSDVTSDSGSEAVVQPSASVIEVPQDFAWTRELEFLRESGVLTGVPPHKVINMLNKFNGNTERVAARCIQIQNKLERQSRGDGPNVFGFRRHGGRGHRFRRQ